MKVYRNLADFAPVKNAVVTTGTFDGVHLGHQTILDRLKDIAHREQGETVLLSFHPHPRLVLFPDDNDLRLLSTLEEKIDLLDRFGIDHFIVHPFTREFSRTSAVEYVRDILVESIGVHKLVIGYDHHFGRNREGSLEQLKEWAPVYGFEVEEIPAQDIDDVNVSSTKIRKALHRGDVATANSYLKYRYPVTGEVVRGDQRGAGLGFPTANVRVANQNKLIPSNGVYVCEAVVGKDSYGAMVNIGTRPTIENAGRDRRIEAHLFNFEGDLYGSEVTLRFIDRIREEQKFEGMDQLKEQLSLDRKSALNILERNE